MASLTGLVLAGGRSRRMGRDKAVLPVGGVRLVDRAVAALQSVCDEVVVAAGDRTIPNLTVPQVPDEPVGCGPIGGLIGGLLAARHPVVVVLAVDHPTPNLSLLTRLAARMGERVAIIPSDGQPQPLHAVWSRSAADSLAGLAADGVRAVLDAAQRLDALFLTQAETTELTDQPGWGRNLNNPGDLDD